MDDSRFVMKLTLPEEAGKTNISVIFLSNILENRGINAPSNLLGATRNQNFRFRLIFISISSELIMEKWALVYTSKLGTKYWKKAAGWFVFRRRILTLPTQEVALQLPPVSLPIYR